MAAVAGYVEDFARTRNGLVNVLIPELFERRSLPSALRRTAAFRLAVRLREQPRVVVTHVPALASSARLPLASPAASEALVLVAEVDDAASHAVAFARALGAARTRAVHVALDPAAAERVRRDWESWCMPLPLDVVQAPYRSLEEPVLKTVRAVTASPDKVAAVVVPAVGGGRWWHDLLHNDRAIYLEWLLAFEPRVVLSGVALRRRI